MAPPLPVLVWTETYVVGGAERFVLDLLEHMPREAFDVRLAGNEHAELDAAAGRPRDVVGVSSMRAPLLGRVARAVGLGPERRAAEEEGEAAEAPGGRREPLPVAAVVAAQRYGQAAANLVRLRRMLRRARPAVLHVNNGGYPGGESCRMASLAARAEGVPAVHFVHNMAYPPASPAAVELRLDRRVDAATTRWATAADRAGDRLAEVRPIPRERIDTVHYGVPDPGPVAPVARESIGFADGALNLLCVASFEARKGQAVLLRALAEVPEARVAFAGTGATQPAMERLAGELGVADRVRFLGWRDDAPALMAAADALVLPSVSNECLPYAILEAMALGLPVISTDVAGIPEEVADGETGRVVPPGDHGALAAALAELGADATLRDRWGAAGRARLEREFSIERMTQRVGALWEGAAAAGPGRP